MDYREFCFYIVDAMMASHNAFWINEMLNIYKTLATHFSCYKIPQGFILKPRQG